MDRKSSDNSNRGEFAPEAGSLDRLRHVSPISAADVEKLIANISEYDYETSSALSRLRHFDQSSLDPELVHKLDERKKIGVTDSWEWAPGIGWGTALFLAITSVVSLLSAIVMVVVVAVNSDVSSIVLAVPFILPVGLAIASYASGRRAVAHPLHLTEGECRTIDKANKTTGFVVTEATYRISDSGVVIRSQRRPPRDAEKIAYAADRIITDIRKSAAWKSPLLDEHRIRLDLDRERFEIAKSAALLDKQQLSAAIDPDVLEDEGPDVERLRQAVERSTGLIDEMRGSLVNRVAALLAYREELTPLDRLIKQMKALDQLEEQQEGLHQAYTEITLNELATSDTQRMADELTALRANLTAQIEFVRANVINSPALGSGLALIEEH